MASEHLNHTQRQVTFIRGGCTVTQCHCSCGVMLWEREVPLFGN